MCTQRICSAKTTRIQNARQTTKRSSCEVFQNLKFTAVATLFKRREEDRVCRSWITSRCVDQTIPTTTCLNWKMSLRRRSLPIFLLIQSMDGGRGGCYQTYRVKQHKNNHGIQRLTPLLVFYHAHQQREPGAITPVHFLHKQIQAILY